MIFIGIAVALVFLLVIALLTGGAISAFRDWRDDKDKGTLAFAIAFVVVDAIVVLLGLAALQGIGVIP